MNWRTLFPLAFALVITGCSTAPNEITQVREGVLRAVTYVQASDYCDAKSLTPRWLGKAPAEQGVLFQCY
jgi:starvation-inducible outer membrane lipoprotein